jgi:hypothetical protein
MNRDVAARARDDKRTRIRTGKRMEVDSFPPGSRLEDDANGR